MRNSFFIFTLGLIVAGCGMRNGKQVPDVLLEHGTPVTVTTNRALEAPHFPLKCEAVGFDGPDGSFEPVMLLTSPLPRGASQTRPLGLGWPEMVKIYRGTNQVAASNHFLGEFQVVAVASEEEKSKLEIGFELSAQKDLFVNATDETGGKRYEVRRVGASAKR